jgi:succinyl-diaminopimelate desuccinylase
MALDPQTILNHLDSQREAIFQFCADLVRRPSPNPPGDTRSVADAVCTLLQAHDLPVEVVADQDHTSNLICSVEGLSPGRHFVLIGHMDTYPAGDETQWARPPFSGGLENGRLHGRGAGDMKSGLTALLFAYLSLASQRQFNGRLTLLAVSDEMNFSPHGARLLVARRPDLLGDAVVDAEPTSPDFVLFGEKGMLWIEVTCKGASGAAADAGGRRVARLCRDDHTRHQRRLGRIDAGVVQALRAPGPVVLPGQLGLVRAAVSPGFWAGSGGVGVHD